MAERILRRPAVLQATGLSTSTIYELMAAGDFPKPIRLSKRAVGWPESAVMEWLEQRKLSA
ncbi:MAG: helix-turn-helix transcriptional regulator [Pseudomonadota bacterium]